MKPKEDARKEIDAKLTNAEWIIQSEDQLNFEEAITQKLY